MPAVLDLERFVDERHRYAERLTPAVSVRDVGRGTQRRGSSSAEAVRSLKESLGIPTRPTTLPVDVWSKN